MLKDKAVLPYRNQFPSQKQSKVFSNKLYIILFHKASYEASESTISSAISSKFKLDSFKMSLQDVHCSSGMILKVSLGILTYLLFLMDSFTGKMSQKTAARFLFITFALNFGFNPRNV